MIRIPQETSRFPFQKNCDESRRHVISMERDGINTRDRCVRIN